MIEFLWLVPLLPLAGCAVLLATRGELSRRRVELLGVGSVGASAVLSILIAVEFLERMPETASYRVGLLRWMAAGGFSADFGLKLDALSLVMILVITVVGFLIHWYSTVYMAGDEGYSRFFAYMNLFTAAMLVLVLADNLLLLYVGWEGVGLCSYLLIGFWYRDPQNGFAARKAFVVTRAGDTAMLIGLILIATSLGTLEIEGLTSRAAEQWPVGSGIAVAASALLLAGALGKSAQLPLQTWLPDAMAGPTPVSALIHAATMVTAGMYLIARMHALFTLAPVVQLAVALLGTLTLLAAAFSALAQSDIKRILAYSTMSQIGYMFLALGVGAWSAAVFHFMTHAFFKALLFLAAGALILAMHHEQDIFRMGGLRRRMPGVFWAFLIGAAALAAVPAVTSGFYSKEQILAGAWAAPPAGPWLAVAGVVAAFLTSVYIFRAVLIVFFGAPAGDRAAAPDSAAAETDPLEGRGSAGGEEPERNRHAEDPAQRDAAFRRYAVMIPLAALAVLSVVAGLVETPATLGGVTLFSELMHSALPAAAEMEHGAAELVLELAAAAASLGGIAVAFLLFRPGRGRGGPPGRAWPTALDRLWAAGWGFDRLYDAVFVRPFVTLARLMRADEVDRLYDGVAASLRAAWRGTARSQTGELRWYAAAMLAGLVIVMAASLFL